MRPPSQCPGTVRSAASAGRWLIMISGETSPCRACGRAPCSQAGREFTAHCALTLDEEGLRDGFVTDAHRLVVREVDGKRRAICSGLQALTHRRSFRGPCRRPFHGTAGPRRGTPLRARTTPASLSSRSEERREGTECVSTCRSRWARYH